jgi:hypothetical protein
LAEGVGGGGVDGRQLSVDLVGRGRVEVGEEGAGTDLAVRVADLAEQVEGPPVAGDGGGGVAQLEVGVGQA